ncbi:type VI secretion system lipoprotein TssJ [Serratia plymuthica]|uniref:Type VI secretion system lipoprotein TssJ n=1 Tax=Serratia plymuthica TaxID=82996 RepID=A0A2X4UHF5_SERPL|nr:type VI secretion system lipoprotein TssJ [Serratia plymuthica]QPS22290.1 type VI secretion system lipoprotein TssJ [Serratia plymuthica]QPS55194.1 type VI secretion system lipoprotein TssJ [Serratia plymuthica]QPS63900.1 type VI secretion system lipoprotein TssJ [Serratia plymuthica]RKS63708.1 type VI secretion system protein VasD [Serratia plymuthica]UNK27324.1 type VI secretion system lipoprotein TssJ [Serratia plymuthica]
MFCRTEITKYRQGMLTGAVAILMTVVLASCSSSKEPKPAAGEIKINLIADKDINPNGQGRSAPLNIFIFNVKETDVFSNADFFEIVDGSSKPVQSAASKIYEAILQPGESRAVLIKPDSDARTLGFVGAYRDLNDSLWLVSWDLPKKKKSWWRKFFSDDSLELNAHFQKTAITIKKMD